MYYRYGILELVRQECIHEFSKIRDLKDLKDGDKNRILFAFLIKWGEMQRYLGKSGLDAVYEKLKDAQFGAKIEPFRKREIMNIDNLEPLKTDITWLFNKMAETEFSSNSSKNKKTKHVCPTTASKVLHLCCPKFFIMWDLDIRRKNKLRGNGNEYFQFLVEMQKRMRQLQPTLRELEQKYQPDTATTFIDKVNWFLAHPEKEEKKPEINSTTNRTSRRS